MAQVTLLVRNEGPLAEAVFAFEHAMAHREVLGAMSPLTQFSVIPYFIYPMHNENQPGSTWHLNHQQAHNDVLSKLPSIIPGRGLDTDMVLRDSDLSNPRQGPWWTFANHQIHFLANAAVLPQTGPGWTYPFW